MLEDRVRLMWSSIEREGTARLDMLGTLLVTIEHDVDTTYVPFEDWVILDRRIAQLQLELGGGTRMDLPVSDTRLSSDMHRHRAAATARSSASVRGPRRHRAPPL